MKYKFVADGIRLRPPPAANSKELQAVSTLATGIQEDFAEGVAHGHGQVLDVSNVAVGHQRPVGQECLAGRSGHQPLIESGEGNAESQLLAIHQPADHQLPVGPTPVQVVLKARKINLIIGQGFGIGKGSQLQLRVLQTQAEQKDQCNTKVAHS